MYILSFSSLIFMYYYNKCVVNQICTPNCHLTNKYPILLELGKMLGSLITSVTQRFLGLFLFSFLCLQISISAFTILIQSCMSQERCSVRVSYTYSAKDSQLLQQTPQVFIRISIGRGLHSQLYQSRPLTHVTLRSSFTDSSKSTL